MMVVCYKMRQAHAKTKAHTLYGISNILPYWVSASPAPYRFFMVTRDATSGQSSFSKEL